MSDRRTKVIFLLAVLLVTLAAVGVVVWASIMNIIKGGGAELE